MGKWNEQFMKGVNDLIKLKVPVQAQLKDVQTFALNLDAAEKVNNELLDIKTKIEVLLKDKATKQEALKKYFSAIQTKIPEYDKARNNLTNVMKKDKNAAGETACNALLGGLNRVEGLMKDPVALKF